jgi:anti-anti-sigma regulatory factor
MHAPALESLDLSRSGRQEIALAGELDCATLHDLDAVLDARDGDLVLDLSCTTFADSCLVHVLERQVARGRDVTLTGVGPAVQALLETIG